MPVRLCGLAVAVVAALLASAPAVSCPVPGGGLGIARAGEIDAAAGPLFGDITKYEKEPSFLAPGEVVLTFDDGPMPWITRSILDTLDRFCTKATFFSVGRMALAYPGTVREVIARGHTLGGHTHTHPLNIARLKPERATDEIERGLAAVALAAGQPIAPFFRFPGLSDSPALLAHLQQRGIASFTVDVVSNDSYIGDARRLARLTLDRIEARRGGIVLFHDIKAATAKALPEILSALQAKGYKVVHLRAKAPLMPVSSYTDELQTILDKAEREAGSRKLVPFYGTTGPERVVELAGEPTPALPVTQLSPVPRQRLAALASAETEGKDAMRPRRQTGRAARAGGVRHGATVGGEWSTYTRRISRRDRAKTEGGL